MIILNNPNSAMTQRRSFVMAGAGTLALGRSVHAQQPGRTYRLGWLDATATRAESYQTAFISRLREMGFDEGRNLVVEFRTTAGRAERINEFAAEIAKLNCDVILVPAPEYGLTAMKNASKDEPIVMIANDYDPVASGHVAQMARPGGRITGISQLQAELPAKRLQVLKELMPALRRVGVLADSATVGQLKVAREAAPKLGLELVVHEFAQSPYDYDAAFASFTRARAEALLALASGNFVPARRLIPQLAVQHRLPGMFSTAVWVEAGGLLGYGPNFTQAYQRAAEQVAKILNGTKPGEMPVEQPNAVEMAINMVTAKSLGVVIPQSLRLRADRLIE
jgi:putative tryptophan/tyrosine transport system substrate-binding protein